MTDLEIAQAATLKPIQEIAQKLGVAEENLECYGRYKAKISLNAKGNSNGRLILVTAINPTSAGEGKSTTTIGLGDAFSQLGYKSVIALREPSFGPVLGVKGGAAGGGYAQVVPMEDINLQFTGDFYAIELANNTVSAVIDNHIYQGNELHIDPTRVIWHRVIDMNDRALRNTIIGLGGSTNGVPREDHFDIVVASEIMAILCLAKDENDLRERLSRTVVAYNYDREPITIEMLGATGALMMILKDAIKPNLVQTLEHTPCLIHGGPFANIAHGCNSLIATKMAMSLSDYTVTEAGFGADLGAEKFFDIVCREGEIKPNAVVIVATIRALKMHGGVLKEDLATPNVDALLAGVKNLERHVENIKKFGLPFVIAVNEFITDTKEESEALLSWAEEKGYPISMSRVWADGGKGALELAQMLINEIDTKPNEFKYIYSIEDTLKKKITKICTELYGATTVEFTQDAKNQMARLNKLGFGSSLVCMAKTQYSFSDNPKLLGAPSYFTITIKGLTPSIGAGFIVALSGDIMRMPGLPKDPALNKMDIVDGKIKGLF